MTRRFLAALRVSVPLHALCPDYWAVVESATGAEVCRVCRSPKARTDVGEYGG